MGAAPRGPAPDLTEDVMRSRLWALVVSAALPYAVPAVAVAATIHVEPDHLRTEPA